MKMTKKVSNDINAPLLLEIPGRSCVITGNQLPPDDRKTAVKTRSGTPVSYTFVFATRKTLLTRNYSEKETYKKLVSVTLEEGAEMGTVDSLGLSVVDGIHKILQGSGVVLMFVSLSVNGHFRITAAAVCFS